MPAPPTRSPGRAPTRSLIAPRWRRRVAVVAVIGFAALAALAVLVAGRRSTSFDDWLFRELFHKVGPGESLTLLSFSAPTISISLAVIVAIGAALVRRWDLAALAVIAPSVTVLLTREVLKPLTGRSLVFGDFHVTGVFPSGHESAVASTAGVLVIALFQVTMRRRTRAAFLVLLAAWVVVAALGLIRNFWHYPTDTMGSICLATGMVAGVALAIDRYGVPFVTWLRSRRRGSRQLTNRS